MKREPPYLNYPRADRRRKKWIIFNGYWKFLFDDLETLKPEEALDPSYYNLRIRVPYPYQSRLSGIGENVEHNVVWYWNDFSLTNNIASEGIVLLHFGAVDYEKHVWLNGRYLGFHVGL